MSNKRVKQPLPLMARDYYKVIRALMEFRTRAGETGRIGAEDAAQRAIEEIHNMKLDMPKLECNCWNCTRPHCRRSNKTVFCYGHPDVGDYAWETSDAELNVCENWRGKAKRQGWCLCKYGCDLGKDGKCSLSTWCAYQGPKSDYDKGIRLWGHGRS